MKTEDMIIVMRNASVSELIEAIKNTGKQMRNAYDILQLNQVAWFYLKCKAKEMRAEHWAELIDAITYFETLDGAEKEMAMKKLGSVEEESGL